MVDKVASKKLVVVVAGSLGSATINNKMKEFLSLVGNENYEVLYITGKSLYVLSLTYLFK